MPELVVTTMQPVPLWTAAALLVLLLIVSIGALRRSGSFGSIATLFGIPALLVIAWSAWTFADQAVLQQRVAERDALNARALQLTAAAMVPGSALACLNVGAGEPVGAACESAIFLRPETVAAATSYVEARLQLLADSLDYSRRAGRAYDGTLVNLRRSLESDRYGFVAHVLATRDGCTADACDAFALFGETDAVKANITAQMLENTIARHAATWPSHQSSPVAAAPPPPGSWRGATLSSGPMAKPIDFPSAASIPPVSIMTEPPAATASAPTEAAPARRPAAPAPAAARPR